MFQFHYEAYLNLCKCTVESRFPGQYHSKHPYMNWKGKHPIEWDAKRNWSSVHQRFSVSNDTINREKERPNFLTSFDAESVEMKYPMINNQGNSDVKNKIKQRAAQEVRHMIYEDMQACLDIIKETLISEIHNYFKDHKEFGLEEWGAFINDTFINNSNPAIRLLAIAIGVLGYGCRGESFRYTVTAKKQVALEVPHHENFRATNKQSPNSKKKEHKPTKHPKYFIGVFKYVLINVLLESQWILIVCNEFAIEQIHKQVNKENRKKINYEDIFHNDSQIKFKLFGHLQSLQAAATQSVQHLSEVVNLNCSKYCIYGLAVDTSAHPYLQFVEPPRTVTLLQETVSLGNSNNSPESTTSQGINSTAVINVPQNNYSIERRNMEYEILDAKDKLNIEYKKRLFDKNQHHHNAPRPTTRSNTSTSIVSLTSPVVKASVVDSSGKKEQAAAISANFSETQSTTRITPKILYHGIKVQQLLSILGRRNLVETPKWEKCDMETNNPPIEIAFNISNTNPDYYTNKIIEIDSKLDELEENRFSADKVNVFKIVGSNGDTQGNVSLIPSSICATQPFQGIIEEKKGDSNSLVGYQFQLHCTTKSENKLFHSLDCAQSDIFTNLSNLVFTFFIDELKEFAKILNNSNKSKTLLNRYSVHSLKSRYQDILLKTESLMTLDFTDSNILRKLFNIDSANLRVSPALFRYLMKGFTKLISIVVKEVLQSTEKELSYNLIFLVNSKNDKSDKVFTTVDYISHNQVISLLDNKNTEKVFLLAISMNDEPPCRYIYRKLIPVKKRKHDEAEYDALLSNFLQQACRIEKDTTSKLMKEDINAYLSLWRNPPPAVKYYISSDKLFKIQLQLLEVIPHQQSSGIENNSSVLNASNDTTNKKPKIPTGTRQSELGILLRAQAAQAAQVAEAGAKKRKEIEQSVGKSSHTNESKKNLTLQHDKGQKKQKRLDQETKENNLTSCCWLAFEESAIQVQYVELTGLLSKSVRNAKSMDDARTNFMSVVDKNWDFIAREVDMGKKNRPKSGHTDINNANEKVIGVDVVMEKLIEVIDLVED